MENKGTIGIFDSGLGGLWILKHLREVMPEYAYVFFGDQVNVPYGTKSKEELFECTTKVLAYLYGEKNCYVVLLACNTVSSAIYDQLRAWVEKEYPGRYIFGIVRPTVLSVSPSKNTIAVFGTTRTVESHMYKTLLTEAVSERSVSETALPELCSYIESGRDAGEYIASFKDEVSASFDTGILACTHYGIVRDDFKKAFPYITEWICQEDIIPSFFRNHMDTKKEFAEKIIADRSLEILVSKENPVFNEWLAKWYGENIKPNIISVYP